VLLRRTGECELAIGDLLLAIFPSGGFA